MDISKHILQSPRTILRERADYMDISKHILQSPRTILRERADYMDISKKKRVIHSMFLYWAYIGLGWAIGQEGPSFTDLRMIIRKDLDTASWLFTVLAIGNMVGSLIGGILYDRYNKVLMIALSAVVLSCFLGVTPWCEWFPVMMVVIFIGGFGSGWLDTGVNASIITLWDQDGGPYMQALHFCFGIGGILSPIATEPFLAKQVCKLAQDNSSQLSKLTGFNLNDTFDNTTHATTCVSTYGRTNVHFAYLITFFVVFSSSVPFFFVYIKGTRKELEVSTQNGSCNPHRENSLPVRQKIFAITLLFLVLLTYCAVEESFFGYLATFCINYLNWSSSTSSYASSLFWITYSSGRLSGIFLVRKFRPTQLLFAFLSLLVLSFVGLLISSLMYATELIWLFIGLVGFAMSIIFPAIWTWTQENVTEVSGKLSSVFLIAASCGLMLNPLLLGYLMDNVSPIWFTYVLLGEGCLSLTLFFVVYNYTCHCINISVVKSEDIRSDKDVEQITHM